MIDKLSTGNAPLEFQGTLFIAQLFAKIIYKPVTENKKKVENDCEVEKSRTK